MLLGNKPLDPLGEQRLWPLGPRVRTGGREIEELLVLERLARRAVGDPVLLKLKQLLDTLQDEDEAPERTGTHPGAASAAIAATLAAATICTTLSHLNQRP